MLKSNRFFSSFGWKVPTHICRARLSGRFAHIQNWGDRFACITIFAPIKANIGGPDEAPRNFPSWSTLLLKYTVVWLMSTGLFVTILVLTLI